MRTAAIVALVSTALVVTGLLTACDKGPTEPSPPVPTELSPNVPFSFSLNGLVQDTVWRPIADVRVEVVDGPGLGAFAMTDARGIYLLPGVFTDTIAVRVSKDGYVTLAKTYGGPPPGVNPPGLGSLYFEMELNSESVNMAGNYTLTFTADSACTQLPVAARTRTYTAVIKPAEYDPSPYAYDGALSGAKFYESHYGFEVRVAGSVARFDLYAEYGEWPLVEELAPSTYLLIGGSALADVGGPTISASFDGPFALCTVGDPIRCAEPVTCHSSNHRLALTRR